MEELRKQIERELIELEQIKKCAEADLKDAPKGTLRISKTARNEQYYWRTDPKDTKGKYIKKSEGEFVRRLAQKDYAKKVLLFLEPVIKNRRKRLEVLDEVEVKKELKEVYSKLSSSRQRLVTPYIESDEEHVLKWLEEKHQKKVELGKCYDIKTEIYTEKGECVRSKSEKILADKLHMMNIPYVYEMPLYLESYGFIKPDFIVLNKRTKREYYWEHFGMMDDREYCEKAIKKMEALEQNGIFAGINLIVTYETKEHPLNVKAVERLAGEFLM